MENNNLTFKNKLNQFVVNGHTGQVVGEYPKSMTKIVSIVVAVLVAVGLLFFLTSCGQRTSDRHTPSPLTDPEEVVSGNLFEADPQEFDLDNILEADEIGKFVTPGYNDEDDSYPFLPDPNGKYYNFETFVTLGDSPWDAFERYEETFTASSTLASSKTSSYDANNLRNDKLIEEERGGGSRLTAWCEGVKGYGIGEQITMRVITKAYNQERESEIHFVSIMIVNGYAKDATTWKNNSRVRILHLFINGHFWGDIRLKDIMEPQIFYLYDYLHIYPSKMGRAIPEEGAYQTDLIFTIADVYAGDKYDDTCLTGIALDVRGGIY